MPQSRNKSQRKKIDEMLEEVHYRRLIKAILADYPKECIEPVDLWDIGLSAVVVIDGGDNDESG